MCLHSILQWLGMWLSQSESRTGSIRFYKLYYRGGMFKSLFWLLTSPAHVLSISILCCLSYIMQISLTFKSTWHVDTSGHLDYFGRAVWRRFMNLLQIFNSHLNLISIRFNCLVDGFHAPVLWNSSSVLWTKKLYSTFYQHEGEQKMTEFLIFLGWTIPLNKKSGHL